MQPEICQVEVDLDGSDLKITNRIISGQTKSTYVILGADQTVRLIEMLAQAYADRKEKYDA